MGDETELKRKIGSEVRRAIEDSGIKNRRPASQWLSENKTTILTILAFLGAGGGQAAVQEVRHDRAQVDGTQGVLEHYSAIIETYRVQLEEAEEDLGACEATLERSPPWTMNSLPR